MRLYEGREFVADINDRTDLVGDLGLIEYARFCLLLNEVVEINRLAKSFEEGYDLLVILAVRVFEIVLFKFLVI